MLCISRIAAVLFLARSASATTYESQPAYILGSAPNPTPDYQPFFPIIYVILGPQGIPRVRSIIDRNDDCPTPNIDGLGAVMMKALHDGVSPIRGFGESLSNPDKLPYLFNVKLCEAVIQKDSKSSEDIQAGVMKLLFKNQTYDVPAVKTNPKKFLLLGDTGMRVSPTNLGFGNLGKDNTNSGGPDCTAPKIYGINQCYTNVTEADLIEKPTGSFQGTNEWFFKEIADHAAKEEVDVIVSVGDYFYREGPCPHGAVNSADGKVKNCSDVNIPSVEGDVEMEEDTVLNFIPGQYGDTWLGWWADWFYPALNLLKSAPIIPTRGNHEICARGGFGYFLFMYPGDVNETAEHYDHCSTYYPPYSVKFEKEQFLVMDDTPIDPLNGGVDHFTVSEEGCPGAPSDGTLIVPVQEDRNLDPTKAAVQIELYTDYFKQIEELSQERETNFYVGHRPIFGIGCDNTSIVTLDWTLQQSLGPTTLDRISGLITGHMHWLEVLEFENNKLPAQIVVGNGGTMLLNHKINQTSIPYINLEVGRPEYNISARVKRGLTLAQYGYGVMERKEDDGYEVTFSVYKEDIGQMESLDFTLSIPAGPRPVTAQAFSASSSLAPFALYIYFALALFTPLALL